MEVVQYRLTADDMASMIVKKCVEITRTKIKEAPAVDAVPVVRCKDCKFRKSTFSGADYFCTVWDADESETAYVTETDFCSYGERRSGDAEIH